jgi:hypothetical protein
VEFFLGVPLIGLLIMVLYSQKNVYIGGKEEKVFIRFVRKVSLDHIIAMR